MNFLSFKDAASMAQEFSKQIPNDYDLIIGNPRSGLWLASFLAGKFGRPLSVPEEQPTEWASMNIRPYKTAKRALLMDDTVSTGKSLTMALNAVKACFHGLSEVHTAALVVEPGAERKVDYYHAVIPHPRLFEWNIPHAKKGVLACDIDGVLCIDPPPDLEYKNEVEYSRFILTAQPHIIPTFEVDYLISCRLEKWRNLTNEWLRQNGVKHKELLLWNLPKPEGRKGKHAGYKAGRISKCNVDYVIESSKEQAAFIAKQLNKPVLCIETMGVF